LAATFFLFVGGKLETPSLFSSSKVEEKGNKETHTRGRRKKYTTTWLEQKISSLD
jgi:hypothetical protein